MPSATTWRSRPSSAVRPTDRFRAQETPRKGAARPGRSCSFRRPVSRSFAASLPVLGDFMPMGAPLLQTVGICELSSPAFPLSPIGDRHDRERALAPGAGPDPKGARREKEPGGRLKGQRLEAEPRRHRCRNVHARGNIAGAATRLPPDAGGCCWRHRRVATGRRRLPGRRSGAGVNGVEAKVARLFGESRDPAGPALVWPCAEASAMRRGTAGPFATMRRVPDPVGAVEALRARGRRRRAQAGGRRRRNALPVRRCG